MTAVSRDAATAQNSFAVRVALLAAGLAAQLALLPLVSGAVSAIGAAALIGASVHAIRTPLTTGDVGRGRTKPAALRITARQGIALGLMLVGGLAAVRHVNMANAGSKAAGLAALLLVVQVAHALVVATRRDAGLGCGIAVAMLAVGGAFGGDVAFLASVTATLAAVAVTNALLRRGSLLDGAAGVGVRVRSRSAAGAGAAGVLRSSLAPLGLATVLAAVAFLALPSPHLQLGGGAFGDNGSGSGGSTGSAGGSSQAGSRAGGETETGPLDLRLRGSHPATPVFTTDADAPAYWQGAIYTDFDGTSWGTASLQRLQAWSLSGQRDQLAPPDPFAVAGERLVTRTDTAQVVSASPLDVVLAPGRPTSYVGPGRVIADSTGTAHLVEGISAAGSAHASFTVTSTQPVDASELRAARGVDLTDPAFTATPADLPVRVGQLASSLTAGSATRLDAVDAVEQYLRTHEAYTLDSPVPAVGEDAVDDFVFVSHLGFCEQFATAAVVMLRSVGIPSRLVTGYAFGDTETSPGKRVFRQEDLHAWVQVWFPGVGWVDSDPTAGAVLQPASMTASQRLGAAVQRAWHRLPAGRLGALGVIAVLAVGGALLAASGRRWAGRRRRLAGLDRGRSGDGPVLAAYLRLDVSLVGAERARDPAETLREVAGRLGGLVATSSEVAAAMSCLERESYGVDPPSPAEIAMAVEVFDRLRVASGSQPVALAFHSLA